MIILLIILINLLTTLIPINSKISLLEILITTKTHFLQWCPKISILRNCKTNRIYNYLKEIWAHKKYFNKYKAKIIQIHTLILIKSPLHNIKLETYKVWLNLYLIHQFLIKISLNFITIQHISRKIILRIRHTWLKSLNNLLMMLELAVKVKDFLRCSNQHSKV